MPGANYMGGRRCASLIAVSILFAKYGGLGLSRNAARARGKDATGKAQRSHFGKKRFEILRTGLSKGQASGGRTTDQAGNGSKGRAEISLAHARRDQAPERQSGRNMFSQLFAFPFASTPRRSSPRSASSRSKILRVLDADNRTLLVSLRSALAYAIFRKHWHDEPRWTKSFRYRTSWAYQPGRTALTLHELIKRHHVLQGIITRW